MWWILIWCIPLQSSFSDPSKSMSVMLVSVNRHSANLSSHIFILQMKIKEQQLWHLTIPQETTVFFIDQSVLIVVHTISRYLVGRSWLKRKKLLEYTCLISNGFFSRKQPTIIKFYTGKSQEIRNNVYASFTSSNNK
jgi:hypothetical protein